MPGKILITEEEFRELCAKYTREEIAKMKGATEGWVWTKTKQYGIKPIAACEVCLKKFVLAGKERQCPNCRKNPLKERSKPAYKPKENVKKSNVFEIEKQMRKQGKNYADYQKAKTIEEFARVDVRRRNEE